MIDKPENYYNFTHPNRWIMPNSFRHRLGSFQCAGIQIRIKPVKCIILHIPDWTRVDNVDHTAEDMAKYLADPPEKNIASVHIFSDSDSFVLAMPSDSIVYGCANQNTRLESIEIEMAGTFKQHANPEFWRSETGIKIMTNAVKAIKQLQILCHFDMPTLQIAKLNNIGVVEVPGFCQHRDVPIWGEGQWRQPPESFKYGQHQDICENFQYDILFDIFTKIK